MPRHQDIQHNVANKLALGSTASATLLGKNTHDKRRQQKKLFEYIWVKLFTNGPSKIYERQPLKNLK